MDIYAIFKQGEVYPIWAGVREQSEAEATAVTAAVNHGNVELLSGPELVDRLGEAEGLIVSKPGPGVVGSSGETDEHGVMRWHRGSQRLI